MRLGMWMRCAVICGITALIAYAGQPMASWEGPVGLYTTPTAETLAPHDYALTFAEIRFSQESASCYKKTTWFTGSMVYTVAPRWEVALTSRHEVVDDYTFDNNWPIPSFDTTFLMGHVKYVLTQPGCRKVGVAAGVFDITDASREPAGVDTNRGRRAYLVGTLDWFSLGTSYDARGFGVFAGARWAVTDTLDLIAEIVSEPMFTQVSPCPGVDYNFNVGMRFYPQQVPNMRFDLAAVGDGRFDFGFSYSYLFK